MQTRKRISFLRAMRPFLELLVRATVWFPLGLIIFGVWLTALTGMLISPVGAMAFFYSGDWKVGLLWLAGGVVAFWFWRFLNRLFWQTPESFL